MAASISGRRSGGWSHAQRAFRLLPGGVGADRGAVVDRAGVDLHLTAVDGEVEAVESARRRAGLLLADAVVLRAVAGAFEPLRRLAERDTATEVYAPLVQRDHPVLLHAVVDRRLVDLLRLR